MNVSEIIEFLETDRLSATFSAQGLKYLSLKTTNGEEIIDLKDYEEDEDTVSHRAKILVKETAKFLATGHHGMALDLSEFTPFQQAVFNEVSKISVGRICTYKDLAIRLGKPGGAQAVGNAISKNPVSYFIPTHRVLSQKGLLICRSGAGFLREKLLKHEGIDIDKIKSYVCDRKKCIMMD